MILGASILQLPAIEKAVDMGLRVVVLDYNPDAVGFQVPGVIFKPVSTTDIDGAIRIAKEYHIDGVLTLATDRPIRTVAAVAKECGLIGVSEDTAIKATDKAVMRECLAANHVPIPGFVCVNNEQDYLNFVAHIKKPFVIKPVDSSGSRGILKIDSFSEDTVLQKAYEYAKRFSNSGGVMIEEYMTGPEVSVETMAIDGNVSAIQITDKLTTGAPYFVEMGHTQPSRLDAATLEKIKDVAVAANKAIGITDGPSHTEIIVTEDGPKIVEIGARLGGDCITTHLVPLSTGVDMVEACIRIALGEKPVLHQTIAKGSAIRYFSQKRGTVKTIDGIDEAGRIPGVNQIRIVHGIGEPVTDIIDSASRMGFVIAQGEDAADSVRICEAAIQQIKVVIE